MRPGGGRQVAAQHSHSLEGWYTHICGIKVLAPATIEDARGMLWTALEDPDPVLIFENVMLYNMTGKLAADAGPVAIDKAAVRRAGRDITLITYGGSLWKTLDAAATLAADNIEAEVIDLRTLRPLDDQTIIASVTKTRQAIIFDEGWRSGSLAAEIRTRIVEQAFWELDAPVGRVCSEEVPMVDATRIGNVTDHAAHVLTNALQPFNSSCQRSRLDIGEHHFHASFRQRAAQREPDAARATSHKCCSASQFAHLRSHCLQRANATANSGREVVTPYDECLEAIAQETNVALVDMFEASDCRSSISCNK